MTPTVSVVIPTHNRSALLRRTLSTVLGQRGVDLEVIVVDDGSTDDTRAAVASLDDPRVRVVGHKSPRGVSAARNRGVREAAGAWVGFVDDDDLWAPDKLARQLEAARVARRGWVFAGAAHIDIEDRVLSVHLAPHPDVVVARLPFWNLVPGGCSNVIAARDVLEEAGSFDTQLTNLADWDLWIRLAQTGPPAAVADALVGYRLHQTNSSLDTGLILDEVDLIDGRYGVAVDRGEIYRYLGWVCLRAGRRREALPHFIAAAHRGQLRPVTVDLFGVARHGLRRRIRPRPEPPSPGDARPWWANLDSSAVIDLRGD